MEIIIGSEGMGVPWGKKVIEYMIQKIRKENKENGRLRSKTNGS